MNRVLANWDKSVLGLVDQQLVQLHEKMQELYDYRRTLRLRIARHGIRSAMLAYLRAARTGEADAVNDAWVGMLRAHYALRDLLLDFACEADDGR